MTETKFAYDSSLGTTCIEQFSASIAQMVRESSGTADEQNMLAMEAGNTLAEMIFTANRDGDEAAAAMFTMMAMVDQTMGCHVITALALSMCHLEGHLQRLRDAHEQFKAEHPDLVASVKEAGQAMINKTREG